MLFEGSPASATAWTGGARPSRFANITITSRQVFGRGIAARSEHPHQALLAADPSAVLNFSNPSSVDIVRAWRAAGIDVRP